MTEHDAALNETTGAQAQQFHLTPIALAFVAGIFGALLVDAVKSRFFPPQQVTYHIQIKEFMAGKIKDYGSLKFEDEKESLAVATRFSEAVEQSLTELAREYGGPIFASPAIINGGVDLTAELETRVNEQMRRYVQGRERNELPDD